ncbi:hypothetical protein DNTS_014550 [Danionella cerebrum]|uniref:Sepiapterin reductase n=1 Tax=Danionella cerebrum TaxID=2873325 RepID=A0A553RLV5_9TELE|nr:hypothetical protein DNTS_014550 [Danionella translucida]
MEHLQIISEPFRDLGRALCIVTGASKGFGRTLSLQLSLLMKPGSVLILVARSIDPLESLKVEIEAVTGTWRKLEVRCVQADLQETEGVERSVQEVKEAMSGDIEHLLLINNAGSLGDISRSALSFSDPDEVNRYLALNVSSALSLTAGVFSVDRRRLSLRRTVVNISSLCARRPFKSWTLYCAGKAARDMMFSVLAQEEPEMRVLNYAPGPLDTDMQLQARSLSADLNLRRSFSSMFSSGKLLTCQESGAKLMKLLLEDQFNSGAHLDYYDL